ncbi:TPA: hypothetical protein N0F65_007479 [Lagenidium giganteum]|uniref:DUF2723 domain-containing protein n=1 Tax=Lagenidium giganteum TaxID=4803 RepID=A0AAV2ZFN0_9STRA|nr:TPA: hypothetical protein N0F65_007479 [Lagenidium giganteum]
MRRAKAGNAGPRGQTKAPSPAKTAMLHRTTKPDVSVDAELSAVAWASGALAAAVLAVYAHTLYPSIGGGDSGELVAESCHLGVSHPPGYPLFNMLVHTFVTYVPLGSTVTVAWKANLFNALCDTIAVMLVFHSVLLWTSTPESRGRVLAAFTAAALFAFSPLIWTYAVAAEVFALNNLFAALLVYLVLWYSIDRRLQVAELGAFTCGLAMCNQHTIVLFELPIITWVLWTRRATLLWREGASLVIAFLLGLIPYIYMPLTAIWNPQPGSWGDVTTVAGFIHHLRRADYGTFQLFSGARQQTENLWTRLYLYAGDVATRELPSQALLVFVAVGAAASCSAQFLRPRLTEKRTSTPSKKRKSHPVVPPVGNDVGKLIIAMYLFYLIVFHSLANLPLDEGLLYGVHMRFWQQPNVIVFIWLGVGLAKVMDITLRNIEPTACVAPSMVRFLGWTLRVICVCLVAFQITTWYRVCDQSKAWYIHNYASALLDPLPANAVLFVNFDLQWTSLRYLQRCERRRPDVTIINLSMMTYKWFGTKHQHYPKLVFPGTRLVPFGGAPDGFTLSAFLDANYERLVRKPRRKDAGRGGIFLGGKLNYNDQDFSASYDLVPYGLLDEFRPLKEPPTPLQTWYATQQTVNDQVHARLSKLPPNDPYNDETWEWTIARDYRMKRLSWSTHLLDRTISEDPFNLALLVEATHAMEYSYQFEPRQFWTPAAVLKNLGLAYAQIVKANHDFPPSSGDPFLNDVVGHGVVDKTKYKDRASSRMLEVWHAWLQVPEARQDTAYQPIASIVQQFLPADNGLDGLLDGDDGEDSLDDDTESHLASTSKRGDEDEHDHGKSKKKNNKKKKRKKKKKNSIPIFGKMAAHG